MLAQRTAANAGLQSHQNSEHSALESYVFRDSETRPNSHMLKTMMFNFNLVFIFFQTNQSSFVHVSKLNYSQIFISAFNLIKKEP